MAPPSSVRVEVLEGRDLHHKTKSGCNAFVTMSLSNSNKKFGTATIHHSSEPVWGEACNLPVSGMDANLLIAVHHRNKLGMEDFIGMLTIPLSKVMSISSWAQWKELENKSGVKDKPRGSIKFKVNFEYDSNTTRLSASSQHSGGEASPSHGRRISHKAKNVVKGLSGALHSHGRDRSPSTHRTSTGQPSTETSPQRKLSVDDVMQDLQLEDSFEQAPNERAVIPRSVTYDVGHTGTNDEPSEEQSGSSWSRKSLKMRRRLSLPSVNAHSGGNRRDVSAIEEVGESPKSSRQSPAGSGTNTPAPESSPSMPAKHRRVNTIAQSWLGRTRSSSDSVAAAEEESIAQGNFSALSKQALIRLAAKQQDEIAEKEEELSNLRGYIDAVLSRVIEKNPELLINLSAQQTARDQRDGRSLKRPLIQVLQPNDSGCGSGNTSPERQGSDDVTTVKMTRSISNPVAPSRSRAASNTSAMSDTADNYLLGSLSGGSSHGIGDDNQRDLSRPRSTSNTSSLVDSGSLTGIQGSADNRGADNSGAAFGRSESSQYSARYRPT